MPGDTVNDRRKKLQNVVLYQTGVQEVIIELEGLDFMLDPGIYVVTLAVSPTGSEGKTYYRWVTAVTVPEPPLPSNLPITCQAVRPNHQTAWLFLFANYFCQSGLFRGGSPISRVASQVKDLNGWGSGDIFKLIKPRRVEGGISPFFVWSPINMGCACALCQ